jgi:hypothetical protein
VDFVGKLMKKKGCRRIEKMTKTIQREHITTTHTHIRVVLRRHLDVIRFSTGQRTGIFNGRKSTLPVD